jgi:polar amino acid transport system substrate-binding protein
LPGTSASITSGDSPRPIGANLESDRPTRCAPTAIHSNADADLRAQLLHCATIVVFKESTVIRLLKLFALIAPVLLVTACNATQADNPDTPVFSRIAERGELVLGTSANMAPMTYKNADGKVVGLDIDIARLMAKSMDTKLAIRTLSFAELLPALERGEVDVVISNMAITPRRNLQAAFVGPYMTSGKCIITKQKRLARADPTANLNTTDTHLAVLAGTTSADFVKTLLPEATVTTTESLESAIKMVADDEVDGLMTDYPICLSTLKDNPEANFVSLFSLLTYEPIGIALPANDPLFVNWTENFLQRLEGTGILDEIGKHWFGEFGEAIKVE